MQGNTTTKEHGMKTYECWIDAKKSEAVLIDANDMTDAIDAATVALGAIASDINIVLVSN